MEYNKANDLIDAYVSNNCKITIEKVANLIKKIEHKNKTNSYVQMRNAIVLALRILVVAKDEIDRERFSVEQRNILNNILNDIFANEQK